MSVIFYTLEGKKYYSLVSWKKWQRIDKPRASTLPDFGEGCTLIRRCGRGVLEAAEKIREKAATNIKEKEKNNNSIENKDIRAASGDVCLCDGEKTAPKDAEGSPEKSTHALQGAADDIRDAASALPGEASALPGGASEATSAVETALSNSGSEGGISATADNAPPKGKKTYGEHSNVYLIDRELSLLKGKFPDIERRINELSEGIELKGYAYKSHYAAIQSWAKRQEAEKSRKKRGCDPPGQPNERGWGGELPEKPSTKGGRSFDPTYNCMLSYKIAMESVK